MSTISKTRNSFERLVHRKGADVHWHREIGGVNCPCLTPEGFRDPEWHRLHPPVAGSPPICNDAGKIYPIVQDYNIKGFVQPAFISTRSRSNQLLMESFGEIQSDDHIGIFPIDYNSSHLDFSDWSNSGVDWIEFNEMRFIAVAWNLLPAPDNANVNHHWEVALRRINEDLPNG